MQHTQAFALSTRRHALLHIHIASCSFMLIRAYESHARAVFYVVVAKQQGVALPGSIVEKLVGALLYCHTGISACLA